MALVEEIIRKLSSVIQQGKIYTFNHSVSKRVLEECFAKLQDFLEKEKTFTFAVVGEELTYKNDILFDLSAKLKPFIKDLKKKKAEVITFSQGLAIEELKIFFEAFCSDEIVEIESYLKKKGVRHILATTLKEEGSSQLEKEWGKQKITQEKMQQLISHYNLTIDKSSDIFKGLLKNEEINAPELHNSFNYLFKNIVANEKTIFASMEMKKHDDSTFVHSVNVAILAIYFSLKLGFDQESAMKIGVAGFFHDIGKLAISKKIIGKPTALSENEFAKIQSHTVLGAMLLLRYSDILGTLPVIVAFQHHLRYDRKGYPKTFFPTDLHIASRIVSVCDYYDALRERRSYKSYMPPERIYKIMQKEKGRYFDPKLCDEFFRIIGVFPLSSVVKLSDGNIAVVTEQNSQDLLHPKVKVFALSSGEFLDTAFTLDLKENNIEIEKTLNSQDPQGAKFFTHLKKIL